MDKKQSLENKTTTELLNLLDKLGDSDLDSKAYKAGGEYEQLIGELSNREPFLQILDEDWDTALPAVWRAIEDIQEQIKLLKRHKHDDKSGDVLVRI